MQFTNKQNIQLLWEVLLDELQINNNNKSLVNNIRNVFESNIHPFTSRTKPNASIIELNKQFLSQVVLAVNKLFPNFNEIKQRQEQNIKRIQIASEEITEPYKIEDIQASRQTDFERELETKRMDLENYMTPQKPKEVDFSYGNLDGKITSMDSLIADKMNQRNLEVEQFNNSLHNTLGVNPEQWLKSKETSLNNEKNIEQKLVKNDLVKNDLVKNRLKHINIDENNNISLNQIITGNKTNKSVSFEDSNINIFQKLKRQPIEEKNYTGFEQKQYVEQKSQPLPEIKQEQINRGTKTIEKQPNIPIIPKNEMVKQLNDMNTKIDNLYELVFKLTISIQELTQNKSNEL
jgi:hypothetical protein